MNNDIDLKGAVNLEKFAKMNRSASYGRSLKSAPDSADVFEGLKKGRLLKSMDGSNNNFTGYGGF